MQVGITGATGFIGKILIDECLKKNYSVRVLSRNSGKFYKEHRDKIDIYTADLLDESSNIESFCNGLDVLFHCAGEIRNTSLMYDLHVKATQRLVDCAAGRVKKWIQLSSVGAYGPNHLGFVNESTEEIPVGEYEVTKTLSDNLIKKAAEENLFEITIVRPSNVIGETMSNNSLFSLIKMVKNGLFFYVGTKQVVSNYTHVRNVVGALLLCAIEPKSKNQTYIISEYCSIEETMIAISDGLGCSVPKLVVPKLFVKMIASFFCFIPNFPLTMSRVKALTNTTTYDGSYISKHIGFEYQSSLEDDLKNLGHMLR